MSTANPKVGDRVVHLAHGIGTVIERNGDEVVVELDGVPGKPHKFLLSRGTLRMESEPAPAAVAAPVNAEAERREIFNPDPPPKAEKPPEEPMPYARRRIASVKEGNLFNAFVATINERGRGAIRDLARFLHLNDASIHGWRKANFIPENRREGVQAWIDRKPAPEPAEHKPTTASRKPKVAAAKIPKRQASSNPGPLRGGTAYAGHATPTISTEVAERVVQGMGLHIVEAWIPEGLVMRKARVAVLPG